MLLVRDTSSGIVSLFPRLLANDSAVRCHVHWGIAWEEASQNPAGHDHRSCQVNLPRTDDHARDALGLPAHAHPYITIQGRARGLGGRR